MTTDPAVRELLALDTEARLEESFLERCRNLPGANAISPESFGAFFEAIGAFIEQLLAGCAADRLERSSIRAKRNKRFRRRLQRAIAKQAGEPVGATGAALIVETALATPTSDFEELRRSQRRHL